jgi:integrase
VLAQRVEAYALSGDDFHFSSTHAPAEYRCHVTPSETRVWQPALQKAALGFNVRIHDLRHAHACWLLAGGADLATVMERLGHRQITTAANISTPCRALIARPDSFTKIRKRSSPQHS